MCSGNFQQSIITSSKISPSFQKEMKGGFATHHYVFFFPTPMSFWIIEEKKKKKKQLAYNPNSVCMSQRRPQILTWFALREPHWEGSALYHPNLQMLWLSLFKVLRCLLKHILKESLNIFMACLWAWIFMFLKWILENIFWLDISQSLFQAIRWFQECPRA